MDGQPMVDAIIKGSKAEDRFTILKAVQYPSETLLTTFELLIPLPFQEWKYGRPAYGGRPAGHHRGLKVEHRLTILKAVQYVLHKLI
jgi:hypothetical protein